MKNIHILPTDKPSRLFRSELTNNLGLEENSNIRGGRLNNQHIYITSTEEIADCNCYVINVIGDEDTKRYVFKPIEVTDDYVRKAPLHTYPSGGWCEKIILTTDPDLVKDGIQGIDDEFLEWFGKNPSCDFIEIESQCLIEEKCTCDCINSICKKPYYTLIIPSNNDLKIGDNTNFGIITDLNENSACFGKNKLGVDVWYKRSYVIKFPNLVLDNNEKMYSEDEVWNIIRMVSGMKESGKSDIEISEYFENNKKK